MRLYILSLLLLCLTINLTCAQKYWCCEEENSVIVNGRCPNGNRTKAFELCGAGSAFVVQKDSEDGYKIDESTHNLIFSTGQISKDLYCTGVMNINEVLKDIAIVCFNVEASENKSYTTIGILASAICCIISTVFLLITLGVYCILPELRDLQGKCLMSFITSLLLAFIFLATIQLNRNFNEIWCLLVACALYFSFLCVFFWLNIVSFNVWRTVVHPKKTDKNHLLYIYNAYGWGGPIIMLIVALICHHVPGSHVAPGFGKGICWFAGPQEIWLYFYGPISVLLLINIMLFLSTAWRLWRNNKLNRENKIRSQKFKFVLYLKLYFIMGICWTFEPLSMVWRDFRFWIVTDYINALQGILIFLLLVVFRKRVRRGLARQGIFCFKFANTWAEMRNEECEELGEDEETCSLNENLSHITFNELQT